MKKTLYAGLVVLLPIGLTFWLIKYIFDLLTAPLYETIQKALFWMSDPSTSTLFSHEGVVIFLSRLIALILTFLLILLLGFLTRRFFFKPLLNSADLVLMKLPFIGGIYRLTKDVAQAMLNPSQKTFKETVVVPFPVEGTYALGFVTGDVPPVIKELAPITDCTVFVPTAPHPISGYTLFVPKKAIGSLHISSEETFKFLFSCGVTPLTPPKTDA